MPEIVCPIQAQRQLQAIFANHGRYLALKDISKEVKRAAEMCLKLVTPEQALEIARRAVSRT